MGTQSTAAQVACRAEEIAHTGSSCLKLRGYTEVEGTAVNLASVRISLVFKDRAGGDERTVALASQPPSGSTSPGDVTRLWFEVNLELAGPDLALHEAVWDLYVETATEGDLPLRRRLVGDMVWRSGQEFTSTRAYGDHRYSPHVTTKGGVSVTVSGLPGHVEVGEVWVRDGIIEVQGWLVREAALATRALRPPARSRT